MHSKQIKAVSLPISDLFQKPCFLMTGPIKRQLHDEPKNVEHNKRNIEESQKQAEVDVWQHDHFWMSFIVFNSIPASFFSSVHKIHMST